jgi:hypothetical protein
MKAPRRHRLADVHRDANEKKLIELAEKLGAKWFELGPLDGWIAHRGQWMPVEIKRPEREGTKWEMTPLQKRFMRACELNQAPFYIWRTESDVLKSLNATVSA